MYDDRFGPGGVRQCTVGELARFSSFDNETISFLQSLPGHGALQCIANAVPMGMLSTVHSAIIDHSIACHHAEQAFVTLRSGLQISPSPSSSIPTASAARSGRPYNHPLPPPTPSVVTKLTPTPAPSPITSPAVPLLLLPLHPPISTFLSLLNHHLRLLPLVPLRTSDCRNRSQ